LTELLEELEVHDTRLGKLVLQRVPATPDGRPEIFEVILDDQFLMSSFINHSEIALAHMGLTALGEVEDMDVVVGGLGLGYTADAALDFPNLRSLLVVEYLPQVISWHHRGVVPLGEKLTADKRCRFVQGDFFAMAGPAGPSFDPRTPDRRFHAILVDIDHKPTDLLHNSHEDFYKPAGLRNVARYLHPGGIFGVWATGPRDPAFLATLGEVFTECQAQKVEFYAANDPTDALDTVYLARKG